jgi:hypothetical protein
MAHTLHNQPAAVALRRRARGPLWIAVAAALAAASVLLALLLASGSERSSAPDEPGRATRTLNVAAGVRYDGGPDEGSRGVVPAGTEEAAEGIRYDGGPDEGTRGVVRAKTVVTAPHARYDGGPEEGMADVTLPAAKDEALLHGRGHHTD